MEPLLYLGATVFVTIIVAVAICRYRVAHHLSISYGTLAASSVIANGLVFISLAFYEEGWHIFTREAWTGGKDGWGTAVLVSGGFAVICILPALGVATYYQRRKTQRESNVA
jgi:hypothetical protein